ncbi:MAG: nucleoside monophosphate kinase [bacterium]
MRKQRKEEKGIFAPVVLFLGPQGSGKGTQASLLAAKHGLVHIEVGAMLRKQAKAQPPTPFSRKVTRIMNSGRLVPTAWVLRLLSDRLRMLPRKRGVLLDGVARQLPETHHVIDVLEKHHRVLTHVIFLNLSKKETLRRLSKRWVCKTYQHNLVMGKDVRRSTDRCPVCDSTIRQRTDDTPAAIAKRLEVYRRKTLPVIRYFRKKHLVIRVNGERPIPTVFRDVEKGFLRGPR